MKRFFAVCLTFLSAAFFAEAKTRLSAIVDGGSQGESGLSIERLKIDSRIHGKIALTDMEFVFRSRLDRPVDGAFTLPLSAGQSVYGFAFDAEGSMEAGTILERKRFYHSFDSIVRGKMGESSIQRNRGNEYVLAISSIPSMGTRRLRISIEQKLEKRASISTFRLPLDMGFVVEDLDISITTDLENSSPRVVQGLSEGAHFEQKENGSRLNWSASKVTMDQSFRLDMRRGVRLGSQKIQEMDMNTQETFFFAELNPRDMIGETRKVKSLLVVSDTMNTGEINLNSEQQKFLGKCLSNWRNVDVHFSTLVSNASSTEVFKVRSGDWGELKHRINGIRNEFAAHRGAIDFRNLKVDHVIVFPSAMEESIGDRSQFPDCSVDVVVFEPEFENALLKQIASVSGGHYIDLSSVGLDAAVELVKSNSVQISRIRGWDGDKTDLVFGHLGNGSNDFFVSGRYLGDAPRLEIFVGGMKKSKEERLELDLSKVSCEDYRGLVRRRWSRAIVESHLTDSTN